MAAASTIALVPAAGSGSRLGFPEPKALVSVCGKAILQRSLETLVSLGTFSKIIVLIPPGSEKNFEKITDPFGKGVSLTAGGETRQISVYRGLQYCLENNLASDDSLLLIHDAARCLVSRDVIEHALKSAKANRAVTVAVPIVDTLIKASSEQRISQYISREQMWAVQTPQIFPFGVLLAAHESANLAGRFDYTDDASLLQGKIDIDIVPGAKENLKITTREDLFLAEAIINSQAD